MNATSTCIDTASGTNCVYEINPGTFEVSNPTELILLGFFLFGAAFFGVMWMFRKNYNERIR